MHKTFSNDLFSEKFRNLLYGCGKIEEAISGKMPIGIGLGNVEAIAKYIRSFKDLLEKRGILEEGELINSHINRSQYAINELLKFFSDQSTSKLNSQDAFIFSKFVEGEIKYFRDWSKDDEEDEKI